MHGSYPTRCTNSTTLRATIRNTTRKASQHTHTTQHTQNGKQKTPEWLNKALGIEQQPEAAAGSKTIDDLLRLD